jgi:multidrug efflux pump subunit AcrA (membrane-fusion protein)
LTIRKILNNKKRWLWGGIVLVAVIFSGVSFFLKTQSGNAGNMSKASVVKPLVAVEIVRRQDMLKRIVLSGQTVSAAQVDIAPKYAGHITQVNVILGQSVTAGQVLAVQDTRDVELSIAQKEASIRKAKAEITETKAAFDANYQKADADYQRNLNNYQRYQSLYNTGAISREALDLAKQEMINAKSTFAALHEQAMAGGIPAALEIKQAALVKAQYALEALQKQRDDTVLRAPRSGIIGYRQAEDGLFVQAGQKILTVVDNSNIYLDCQVSEQNAAQIHSGMNLNITIESLGQNYPGTIIYVSPASDVKTQVFTVRIALAQNDDAIKSGMFAYANIEVMLSPQALFVAKEAVLEKNGKNYIFVINEHNQAEQRLVQIGRRNDDAVEILEGILEGERVAISNISRLKADVSVELDSKTNKETINTLNTKRSGERS